MKNNTKAYVVELWICETFERLGTITGNRNYLGASLRGFPSVEKLDPLITPVGNLQENFG